MKAKELRIGNYVYDENKDIIQIDLEWFSAKYLKMSSVEVVNPIPLTPKVLEACGAITETKKSYHKGYETEFDVIKLGKLSYNSSHKAWWYGVKLDIDIQHLHQLQNLYFAITGEELNINIEKLKG